jgi:hypothetical protein
MSAAVMIVVAQSPHTCSSYHDHENHGVAVADPVGLGVVGVGVGDGVGVVVGDGVVGVGVGVGVGDGVVGVGDGVGDVVGDGVGLAVCVGGAGATRFGACTG